MINRLIQNANYWKNRPLNDEKKDWSYEGDWIEGYRKSTVHPHRLTIIEELKKIPFKSILEVGCNCAPNLQLVSEHFPDVELFGIDVNKQSIEKARELLFGNFEVADVNDIPYIESSFDVVLADAVLMYCDDKKIAGAIKEIARVGKNIIVVDWYSEEEKVVDFHWSRDYRTLLNKEGFKVITKKLSYEQWPNPQWEKHGYIFTALAPLLISDTN